MSKNVMRPQCSPSRIEGSLGDPIPCFVNDLEAVHDVEMVFPKLLESKVGSFGHLKASLKQCFGIKVFKVQNDLLIHGLEDWSGVGRKEFDLSELKFLLKVVLKTGGLARALSITSKALSGRFFSEIYFFTAGLKTLLIHSMNKIRVTQALLRDLHITFN